MNTKIRVGLIFGGRSGEHEVSLASARSVWRALDQAKYDVVLIGVTKEGRWLVGGNPLKALMDAANSPLLREKNGNGHLPANTNATEMVAHGAAEISTDSVLNASVDVAFPLIHGPYGEDGTVQGLLELADIPYVGGGVAASAVGMDKSLMKTIFRAEGLPIADFITARRHEWEKSPEEVIHRVESAFGYPCFVKPANLGSSVGISKAHDWDELAQALTTAAQFDQKLVVERAIVGREVECSVLGNEEPIASAVGEIIPGREFYDYDAKYADESGTRLVIPAELTPEQTRAVQALAVSAFKAIGCSGMARVDFFVQEKDGRVIVNEINTIPGFTKISMYPKLWDASGLAYPRLVDRLIELALEHHADKKRNRIS